MIAVATDDHKDPFFKIQQENNSFVNVFRYFCASPQKHIKNKP